MKAKKALLALLCVLMIVAASVFGTLAYLTDADVNTNTFTVGNVQIKLDEAKVNDNGTYVTDHNNRVKENKYHLLPNHTYYKDPTVTILKGSEETYVRALVKVENLASLKEAIPNEEPFKAFYDENGLFLLQMLCVDENGVCTWDPAEWEVAGFDTDTYEFRYVGPKSTNGIVSEAKDADIVLEDLFEKITVPGLVNNDQLAKLADVKIVVTAQAIQADGFGTADAAWAAFAEQVAKNPNPTEATTEGPAEETTEASEVPGGEDW